MASAPLPHDEDARIEALHDLGVLDTPPMGEFDVLVKAASSTFGVPIALISLVDNDRQWFKANFGLPGVVETSRDVAFCAHAILGEMVLEVPDATHDTRFADNPLVSADPGIRFYAGAPLVLSNGHVMGTLCIIDHKPRQLDAAQRDILQRLARAAVFALESWQRRRMAVAARADATFALPQRFDLLRDVRPIEFTFVDRLTGSVAAEEGRKSGAS